MPETSSDCTNTGFDKVHCTLDDVIATFLQFQSPLGTLRLQYLCYYAQAWSLAWDNRPLFPDPIEAWCNGPIIPSFWTQFPAVRSSTEIGKWASGDPRKLDAIAMETVSSVFVEYSKVDDLAALIRSEDPYQQADSGAHRENRLPIRWTWMQDYYRAKEAKEKDQEMLEYILKRIYNMTAEELTAFLR